MASPAQKGVVAVHHMDDKKTQLTANFYAGSANGSPVYDELPVKKLSDDKYELLSSPGLALNLAKGDIVEIFDAQKPARVHRRGGNFCIQIYADQLPDGELETLPEILKSKLNGTLDGVYLGNLAISVPAATGVQNIRDFFDKFTERTGVQWYFGNVYKNFENVNNETLLDWWM
jgi:Domain of unknown function (DUF4265)